MIVPSYQPPMYVYSLPSELDGGGLHHLFQGSANNDRTAGATGWVGRGVFEAARVFLERLHRRGGLVSNPEAASLFLVPVQLTQKSGNLWEPQHYLASVVDLISTRYPFWNRTNGADHVFFTTQDLGGCWIHPSMRNAIIISHFGFLESLPFWMSTRRWRAALANRSAPDAPLYRVRGRPTSHGHPASNTLLSKSRGTPEAREACDGPLFVQAARGCRDPFLDHTRSVFASQWQGSHRWHGACYNASKDVVAPTDFVMTPGALAVSRLAAADALIDWESGRCEGVRDAPRGGRGGDGRRRLLLFMSGRVTNAGAPFYSQGVRSEVYRLHHATEGIAFRTGKWHLSQMRDSTFCLCPSGWGFGWRIYLALATLCIPVLVQPMVEQAFHDLLPYSKLAISFPLSDVARLPELLRAVPPRRVCELRAAAAKYYRALLWQEPDGLAHEMLLLSLCRRALALRVHLAAEQSLPTWAMDCRSADVERLLEGA